MMNEEDKFDDLLRNKMSEREFFFDEENWQKASEKIERNELKRKQTRFTIIFLSGLALGIVLTVPIMNLMKSSTADKNLITNNNQGSTTTNTVTTSQPLASTNNAGSNSAAQNVPTNTSLAATSASTKENSSNAATENKLVNNEQKAETVTHTENAVNTTVAANSTPAADKGHRKTATASNTPHVSSASRVTNSEPTTKDITNKVVANTSNHRVRTGNNKHTDNTIAVNTQPASQNKNVNTEVAVNNPTTNTNEASNGTASQENGNTTAAQNNNQTNTATQNQSAANNNTQNNTQQNNTNTTAAQNQTNSTTTTSSNAATQKKDTGLTPMGKHPARIKQPTLFSIDAGGEYSFGWSNFWLNSEGTGLHPVFGISVTHFVSKKFALALGVQYNSIVHLRTGYTNSATNYDFGYTTNYTTITPTTLYYLSVPLYLRYNLDDNDAICLGTSLQYLLNTSSGLTTGVSNTLHTGTVQNKTVYGYTQGFNNTDFQLRLAYRRKIIKALSITAEGYYGLMDVETSFISDGKFKRNDGLRIIFSYDLIK
jgi:hypothetical protein